MVQPHRPRHDSRLITFATERSFTERSSRPDDVALLLLHRLSTGAEAGVRQATLR